ncbi:TPA: PP2C family serine/threonine-protein phosphatase [Vibrio parahaemolyticus]|uniref:PP2C family protein-serine/threonine phosphatase n=2 Tax=Vibrio parahaemolyticus TaxID=670 RepID=UPI00041E65A5|nr:hypothetical protein [Vibrio parahaemolyticus]EGR3260078.1 hypothetical protein [Vibrio parahaemolyticus]KYY00754.1 hypothetical protein AWQ10_07295 [Vibrio parahaemolyticus]
MLKVVYECSFQGDRDENLDRYGHYQGINWSFSYVIDGFDIAEPHYVDSLESSLRDITSLPEKSTREELLNQIEKAITMEHEHKGKASVAFVLCVDDDMCFLTAGDTRIYRLESQNRTLDHSVAQDLVNQGKAPEKTLFKHPYRRYLKRKLQRGSGLQAIELSETYRVESVMLCSDGVWSCFESDDDVYKSMAIGGENLLDTAINSKDRNRDNMTVLHLAPF